MSSNSVRALLLFLSLAQCVVFASAATYGGVTALLQGESGYDAARLAFNKRFNILPYVITYPSTADQVAAIVQQGASEKRQVVARSGGHSYIANGLGGKNGAVVVDLKNFTSITVNPGTFYAVVGAGNRLGKVASTLSAQGRALPHGTCPYVGIGGHATYGGFGFASRMWGLTLDNIVSAKVVLANGTIVTTSSTQHQDLFWAVRGSASSFGIVTSFTFKTYPQPAHGYTFSYQFHLDSAEASNALLSFQDFTRTTNLPPHIGFEITFSKGWSAGRFYVELIGQWFADPAGLEPLLKPLLDKLPARTGGYRRGGTYIQAITDVAGGDLSTNGDQGTDTFYAKSLMVPASSPLTANAVNAFVNTLTSTGLSTNLNWWVQIHLFGGANSAINAVPAGATSFGRRDSLFTMQIYTSSPTYAPPFPDAGFTFMNNILNSFVNNQPSGWNYGMYTNYLDDKVQNWSAPYYGAQYTRLQSIKKAVDPNNVFNFLTSVA